MLSKLVEMERALALHNYDESMVFDPTSKEGEQAVRSLRFCVRMMAILILGAIVSAVVEVWPAFFSVLPFYLACLIYRKAINRKMSKGYPYMEPKDLTGVISK